MVRDRWWLGVALALGFGLLPTPVAGAQEAVGTAKSSVQRGHYLVHSVAKCIECHTPRDSRGNLDRTRVLKGAPVPIVSPFPNRPWAFQAPAIAGLPGWTVPEAVQLLTTGRRASGYIPRPPMPEYRLSREDAADVAAYLKSLR